MSVEIRTASPSVPVSGLPFMVGRDSEGHWVACDASGRRGGLFVSQEAAIDYAEFETGWQPGAIRVAAEPLILRFG